MQNKNFSHLVSILLENDFDSIENLNYINKNEIVNILMQIHNVIFNKNFSLQITSMHDYLTSQLQNIFYKLNIQIANALKFLNKYKHMQEQQVFDIAKTISLKFLYKLNKIKKLIKTDLQAAFDGDPAAFNTTEIVLCYPGLFAIFVNRVAHELYLLSVPLIPRVMTEYAHSTTGIDIHPGAKIGKGFFIDHGTGIVIGETTKIGNNVKIYQGVTLGALTTKGGQNLRGKKRHPTIKDNVVIYSNASILGGKTVIGQNCIIGGNAFITSSVPCNTKVK